MSLAALIIVVHHVLADGIGGFAALTQMADSAVPIVRESEVTFPLPPASNRTLLADVTRSRFRALFGLPRNIRLLCEAVGELHSGRGRGCASQRPSRNSITGPLAHAGN